MWLFTSEGFYSVVHGGGGSVMNLSRSELRSAG